MGSLGEVCKLGCSKVGDIQSFLYYFNMIWQKVCLFIENQVFYGLLSIVFGVSPHDGLAKPEIWACSSVSPSNGHNIWEVSHPISDTHGQHQVKMGQDLYF